MKEYRLKNKKYKLIYVQWLTLPLLLLMYSWYLRNNMLDTASEKDLAINHWDFMLTYISDPKLFFLILFPHFLFNTIRLLHDNYNFAVFMRVYTWPRFMRYLLYRNRVNIVGYIGLLILTSIFWRNSFPIEQEWSILGDSGTFINPVMNTLASPNISPITSYVTQILLLSLFLITFHVILVSSLILLNTNKNFYLYGIAFFIFSSLIISIKNVAPYLYFYKYIYLYQTIEQPLYVILGMCGLILICFFLFSRFKREIFN